MNEEIEVDINIRNKYENTHLSDKKYLNIFKTLVCRLILLLLGAYSTYYLGCLLDPSYYGLLVFSAIIFFDMAYICVFNGGADFKW